MANTTQDAITARRITQEYIGTHDNRGNVIPPDEPKVRGTVAEALAEYLGSTDRGSENGAGTKVREFISSGGNAGTPSRTAPSSMQAPVIEDAVIIEEQSTDRGAENTGNTPRRTATEEERQLTSASAPAVSAYPTARPARNNPVTTPQPTAVDLFADFARASSDGTDPQRLATVTAFATNLATLQGTNVGSSRAARTLEDGRHSASAQVLNTYAAAGQSVSPEIRGIIDELDNLATHGNAIAGMDDRVRMGWTGQGSSSYDIGALERREASLMRQLADLTREVMTEEEQLSLRATRADVSILEHNAATLAAGVPPEEKARWDEVLGGLSVVEIGNMISENNLQDIPRNYALSYQQTMIQNRAATRVNDIESSSLADQYRGSVIAMNYGDPRILAQQMDQVHRENQTRMESGVPLLREIDLGNGIGVVPLGDAAMALAMLHEQQNVQGNGQGRAGLGGTGVSEELVPLMNEMKSNTLGSYNNFLNTMSRLELPVDGSTSLTQGVETELNAFFTAYAMGDVEEMTKASQAMITEAGKARSAYLGGFDNTEERAARASLWDFGTFTSVEQAQDYLVHVGDDQQSVEARGIYSELRQTVNLLAQNEFARDTELYSGLDIQGNPVAGEVPHPLDNLFANDPYARDSANQAWRGQLESDLVQTGLRTFYTDLMAQTSQRTDFPNPETKEFTLRRIQEMHDEIFDPAANGQITGHAGFSLLGRVDFRVTNPDDPTDTRGVVAEDHEGNPIQIREVNLGALVNLSQAHETQLMEMGFERAQSSSMNFAFSNVDQFIEQVAERNMPRSATEKALLTLVSTRYANNMGDPDGRQILIANLRAGVETLEEEVRTSFANEEFSLADSVVELANSNNFTDTPMFAEAARLRGENTLADELIEFSGRSSELSAPEYSAELARLYGADIYNVSVSDLVQEGYLTRQQLNDFNRGAN